MKVTNTMSDLRGRGGSACMTKKRTTQTAAAPASATMSQTPCCGGNSRESSDLSVMRLLSLLEGEPFDERPVGAQEASADDSDDHQQQDDGLRDVLPDQAAEQGRLAGDIGA